MKKINLPNTYVFPAVIEDMGEIYVIKFPDVTGCYATGRTYEEAFNDAKEALALDMAMCETRKDPIPEATQMSKIAVSEKQVVCLIEADMKLFRSKLNGKFVKKNVVIPEYLSIMSTRQNLNLSEVLKETLIDRFGKK